MPNTLFYGDNLQVLGEHVPDDSVGLVSSNCLESQ